MEYIKSPINYAGSKFRLIKKGLLNYFPDNIDTFVDLFGGAGNVSVNVNANNIIYNDKIPYLPKLFNTWKIKSLEEINQHIDNKIKEFNLNSQNVEGFLNFRKFYNENKNIEDLFILICYSFNYQMRFNKSGLYNSSFGKEASTMNDNIRKNLNIFINEIKKKNIRFVNKDFNELKIEKLNKDDFVYLDPPYYLSCAVYQDGGGWNSKNEIELYDLLDRLNENNIKFALSNLKESKGKVNEILLERCNKYNIIELNMSYNNSNYHRKNNGKDTEVLITNY